MRHFCRQTTLRADLQVGCSSVGKAKLISVTFKLCMAPRTSRARHVPLQLFSEAQLTFLPTRGYESVAPRASLRAEISSSCHDQYARCQERPPRSNDCASLFRRTLDIEIDPECPDRLASRHDSRCRWAHCLVEIRMSRPCDRFGRHDRSPHSKEHVLRVGNAHEWPCATTMHQRPGFPNTWPTA